MLPSKIEATEYSATDKQVLEETIKNPLLNNNQTVSMKDITFDINKTNPKLMELLSKIDENSFSPILNTGNSYVAFYVIKKYPKAPLPINMVAQNIYQTLLIQKQNVSLKDFISKLRAKADIKFLK